MKTVLGIQKRKIRRPDEDLVCAIRSSLLKQSAQELESNSTSQTNTKTRENDATIPLKASNNEPSSNGATGKEYGGDSLTASIYAALGGQTPKPVNAHKPQKERNFPPAKPDDKLKSHTSQSNLTDKTKAAVSCSVGCAPQTERACLTDTTLFSVRSRPASTKDNGHTVPNATVMARSPSAPDRNTSRLRARRAHQDAGLMSAVRATMGEQPLLEEVDLNVAHEQRRSMISSDTSPRQFARINDEDGQVLTALRMSLQEVNISDIPLHERPLTEDTECAVCTDVFSPSEIALGFISSACNHSSPENALRYTCKGCVQQHLDVQVQSGASTLTCPICLAELSYYDVKKWATPRTFTRYDRLRTRDAITSDPNFIWCSKPNCDAGQVHESGSDAPIVVCNSCGTKTCFNHQQGWHHGFSCAEFDDPQVADERIRREQEEIEAIERQNREQERKIREQLEKDEEIARTLAAEEDRLVAERKAAEIRIQREAEERRRHEAEAEERKRREAEQERLRKEREERARRRQEEKAGEEAVMSSTKLCPGPTCTYRVHKVDGCKHMTCTRCQFEWCWICGEKWISGHLRKKCSPPARWPKDIMR